MIDRADISDHINILVWSGFEGEEEIARGILEDELDPRELSEADRAWVRQEVRRQMAEKRQIEKTWPAETSWDRLDRVFQRLKAANIIALHDAGYTQSDGLDLVGEILSDQRGSADRAKGYCFYHRQDLERVVVSKELYLSFGAFSEDDKSTIPRMIASGLSDEGFAVEWNGNLKQRILVSGLAWRKRSPTG